MRGLIFALGLGWITWSYGESPGPLLVPVPPRSETPHLELLEAPGRVAEQNVPPGPSVAAPSPADQSNPAPVQAEKKDLLKGKPELTQLAENTDDLPVCLQRAEYLCQHQDQALAISYLRQVVMYGNLPPLHRSRALLVLADQLEAEHQGGESLYWLKIWMGLFPGRPEAGAVAHRMGVLYARMGLTQWARDAYYESLSKTVNLAEVKDKHDLNIYRELTQATLWSLAENEYQAGQWERAGELYQRYLAEGDAAATLFLEKAAFKKADCAYQLGKWDEARDRYGEVLGRHPFNPLAVSARLRLYQVLITQKNPERAKQELEALAWTVHTVWPQDETYWQKQVSELLFRLNQDKAQILGPLIQEATLVANDSQDKHWQNVLNHYNKMSLMESGMETPSENKVTDQATQTVLLEQTKIRDIKIRMDHILPSQSPQLSSS